MGQALFSGVKIVPKFKFVPAQLGLQREIIRKVQKMGVDRGEVLFV